VVCLAPRALEEIARPRRLAGVGARPLNFTVSHRAHIYLLGRLGGRWRALPPKFLCVLAPLSIASAAASFQGVVSLRLRCSFGWVPSGRPVDVGPSLSNRRRAGRNCIDRH